MKTIKILLIAVLFIGAYSASAQWTDSGSNLYTTDAVGIGITTPAVDLNIYDAASDASLYLESPYTLSGDRAIGRIRMTNTSTSEAYNFALRKNGGVIQCVQNAYVTGIGWVDVSLFNYSNRNLEVRAGVTDILYTNSGKFLLNNTGAVGIGTGATAIPAGTKLAINGKVLATEVQVALVANWADYVFNDDYNLKPLSEVENFIKENKHLPDVPSANEVAKDGVNLGEMDATLLQKIEELTLYMINLEKENKKLKERIDIIESNN